MEHVSMRGHLRCAQCIDLGRVGSRVVNESYPPPYQCLLGLEALYN